MSTRTAALIVLLAFCGCESHGEPAKAQPVTLQELGQETSNLDRFSYLGTDRQFHYFKTPGGRYYKLAEAEWHPPNRDEMIHDIQGVQDLPAPGEPSFEQYVAVKQGQIVLAPLP